MKFGLKIGAGLLLVLVVVLGVRTIRFESRRVAVDPGEFSPLQVDSASVARHLAAGLRHKTISHSVDGPVEAQAFLNLHAQLRSTYPQIHANLTLETVSDYSLVYTWKGKRPELPVVLLLAHQDVVPVEPGTEDAWEHPPFSGDIEDGYVWGRGAIDDKGALYCIMEAVEGLLARGFVPERTIMLAFGHDEEIGGPAGATQIAAMLAKRSVEADFVLDEGGVVTEGAITLIDRPIAVIGIAEKGYLSIELVVETAGGHSSMPPRHTAIGILSAAIVALEANPVPGGIDGAVEIMFDHLGPELDFPIKLVMANRWLFGPILERVFAADSTLDAMQRTTTAATIFNGGVKANVLPSRVKATVNFRILPGDTIDSVHDHVKRTIDDERIKLTLLDGRNPSPISSIDSPGFKAIQQTISGYFPDAIVTPYLVVGGTDSRFYSEISQNLYRFAPFRMTGDDRKRIHGTNERIEIATLGRAVGFYTALIEKTASR